MHHRLQVLVSATAAFGLGACMPAHAQEDHAPLLSPAETQALVQSDSGTAAKRTIAELSLHHRMRGSVGYNAAAALIEQRLKEYGLDGVEMIRLPADGKIFYGTQRSRPAWNGRFAELWEQRQQGGNWVDRRRITSWADQPISLAQDSVSGHADADLVDVGAGSSAADYAGKDVRGKLVLVSSQPEAVARLAVTEHGAAGIISWVQNQPSAWWGDDTSLVRWGHLDTWQDPTFAFTVSPAQAHAWQARLAKGETVRLRADVDADRSAGEYRIPTAIIPGRDKDQEVVLSCHLDHPSPGANDNASGCAGVLEIARDLHRLIAEKKLPEPRRTIRFIWPCEIECTISLLNARPEIARRTVATIHLDMIGGNTAITHGTLRVRGTPPSLPSFVPDVAFAIARWVDAQSQEFADVGHAAFPLNEQDGTKLPLHASIGGFEEGSDHQVWDEGSWRIPAIYLADWPDPYIHTNKDVVGNIDSTKLRRAIFIASASAWVLANLDRTDTRGLNYALESEALLRHAGVTRRAADMDPVAATNLWRNSNRYDVALGKSLGRFDIREADVLEQQSPVIPAAASIAATGDAAIVYQRSPKVKGPMVAFGYSWFDDHLAKLRFPEPALLSREPTWDGPSFGYEALNLVDGTRTVAQIRDDLAATVGPAPIAEVAQYLATLEQIGVIERKP
ncbi:MAG: DUF4910 domain-containing protein [Rhodanobacter sp.]